jgi:hypothetical protein
MKQQIARLVLAAITALLLCLSTTAPSQARFVTPDTWDPWMEGVDINRYVYGNNDPINKSDPNGHCSRGGREDADCDGDNDFDDRYPGIPDKDILQIGPSRIELPGGGRIGGGMSRSTALNIASRIDQAKIRNYMNDIQRLTGYRVSSSQRIFLANDLRTNTSSVGSVTGAQLGGLRRQFENSRNRLISEWEKNTGQSWPEYTPNDVRNGIGNRAGAPYEPHHIRQLADGGRNTWWNITPASQQAHRSSGGIHRSGGALQSLRSFFRSLFGG